MTRVNYNIGGISIFLMFIVMFSCQEKGSKKQRNPKKSALPYRIIKTDPAFWKVGDSVTVSLEAIFDSTVWRRGSMEVHLPYPEPNWIDSDTFKLLWVPDDSLRKINPPIAKVIDGFTDISYKFEIMREVEFHAIRNSEGKYHFERQEPTSVIDTFFYERYKDD